MGDSLFSQAAFEKLMDQAAKFEEWNGGEGFIIDDKKAIHRNSVIWELEADSFVNTATNTITTNSRFENFFGDDDTKTLPAALIVGVNKAHEGGADGLTFLIGVAHATTRMEAKLLG